MIFRPCIDLHGGRVKQIVGSTLSDRDSASLKTNFQSDQSARWFAERYRADRLPGGHVIMLGPGNERAAEAALSAWPGGLQVGGGITLDNAQRWIAAGAAAVIVTSWVFDNGRLDQDRLVRLSAHVGKDRLVLDLSCRRQDDGYSIATDRWQRTTRVRIEPDLLDRLSAYCCEFLVHGVDVEGRCQGIETELVAQLGAWAKIPITYAGGIHTMADIRTIATAGRGRIDFTVGSALDIFGGCGLVYADLAARYGPDRSSLSSDGQ